MSKNGGYPSKHSAYPIKHVCLHEIFHKEECLSMEKVILMAKFANHYKTISKRNGLKGWLYPWFL